MYTELPSGRRSDAGSLIPSPDAVSRTEQRSSDRSTTRSSTDASSGTSTIRTWRSASARRCQGCHQDRCRCTTDTTLVANACSQASSITRSGSGLRVSA